MTRRASGLPLRELVPSSNSTRRPPNEGINALIALTDVNEEIGLDKAESFAFFEELHCALHVCLPK